MNRLFYRTGSNRPGRSVFDLSYEKKFDCDMGQLIPIVCDEMVPGDKFVIGLEAVLRFMPMIAPILHTVNVVVHYFFGPYRLLDENFEEFITGGLGGEQTADGLSAVELSRWEPTNTAKGSLWDYLGFPVGVDPDGAYPLDFPRRMYNRTWNQYYRSEDLQEEVLESNEEILNCGWEKDYFTSALPWQQRGTAPALPVSGTTKAVWDESWFNITTGGSPINFHGTVVDNKARASAVEPLKNLKGVLNSNTVDLSTATTFDVADLRLSFQVQKWMERNLRTGVRYTEFLLGHFGVSARDERLDRIEYVGGAKFPVVVSEVLQTSSTDVTSPQGNLAGHALAVEGMKVTSFTAPEFGILMGIMSIRPKSAYQQGINRQWLRRTRYDFYFPEFANLSEQGIERAEIFASNVAVENTEVFGFQGRFDEMRVKNNLVANNMRDTLDYWHLGRKFTVAPELNGDFIEMDPAATKRIFAAESEPGIVVSVGNRIKGIRPLPIMSNPGLIDH